MMTTGRDLQIMFDIFCETSSDRIGQMPLAGVQAWFKEVGITGDNTGVSEFDVENAFKKSAKEESGITFSELKGMVGILAQEKQLNADEMIDKLSGYGELQPDPSDEAKDKNDK
ncbi:hypothetical protein AVEN_244134-1 [Araneus ventricosus]|uniref:EF-hand domain-containing protein n=1 Tax=Araneus ventricosus TaxID=182803 RepID=A0A4Y2X2Y2_ARAVE|nr:hypothetical protein AVEN_244134-1 [Araneus ventricosus]